MAKDYEFIKSRLTVFVQDGSIDTFDPSMAYAVAYASSYNLDITGDTQDIVDMADCFSDWANPEVNKKSWTLSGESLLLRPNTGNGTVDIGDKYYPYALEVGQIVWNFLADASCGAPFNPDTDSELPYRYGKSTVTSLNQSGTQGDFHTFSYTFAGKGAILKSS